MVREGTVCILREMFVGLLETLCLLIITFISYIYDGQKQGKAIIHTVL